MGINSPFTMVVLIVLITVGARVISTWIKSRPAAGDDAETRGQLASLHQDVARVTERVRVLEKITTDGEARLRDEISRLS